MEPVTGFIASPPDAGRIQREYTYMRFTQHPRTVARGASRASLALLLAAVLVAVLTDGVVTSGDGSPSNSAAGSIKPPPRHPPVPG